ncbi:MAG: hypothetical protein V7752_07175 [Halopseudomonas sp.]
MIRKISLAIVLLLPLQASYAFDLKGVLEGAVELAEIVIDTKGLKAKRDELKAQSEAVFSESSELLKTMDEEICYSCWHSLNASTANGKRYFLNDMELADSEISAGNTNNAKSLLDDASTNLENIVFAKEEASASYKAAIENKAQEDKKNEAVKQQQLSSKNELIKSIKDGTQRSKLSRCAGATKKYAEHEKDKSYYTYSRGMKSYNSQVAWLNDHLGGYQREEGVKGYNLMDQALKNYTFGDIMDKCDSRGLKVRGYVVSQSVKNSKSLSGEF